MISLVEDTKANLHTNGQTDREVYSCTLNHLVKLRMDKIFLYPAVPVLSGEMDKIFLYPAVPVLSGEMERGGVGLVHRVDRAVVLQQDLGTAR